MHILMPIVPMPVPMTMTAVMMIVLLRPGVGNRDINSQKESDEL